MKSLLQSQTTAILFRLVILAVLLITMLISPQVASAAYVKCYVDANAPGPTHNGTSWATAFTDLQNALTTACNEVWVADGLYKPGTTYTDTFQVKRNVKVYGGFGGYGVNETDISQQKPDTYLTILSGDVDNNDAVDARGIDLDAKDIRWHEDPDHPELATFNALHVVYMYANNVDAQDITSTTVLDGFTITGGYASGGDYDYPNNSGGGMLCNTENARHCDPTLSDLVFIGNRANLSGGGLFNDGSSSAHGSPIVTNVKFIDNMASDQSLPRVSTPYNPLDPDQNLINGMCRGGGMANYAISGWSEPVLTDVTFEDNYAETGGGAMVNLAPGGYANAHLTRVTFSNNSTAYYGGAMYNDASSTGINSLILKNVTFNDNSAVDGGAIYNFYSDDLSAATYNNVTFSGNSASGLGGAFYYRNNRAGWLPQIKNSIFWGDSASEGPEIYIEPYGSGIYGPTFSTSVIQGSGGSGTGWITALGTDGGGNLDDNPRLGTLLDHGGLTLTMALLSGSSAIDHGLACEATDQRGVSRPQGAGCDIGAFEGFFFNLPMILKPGD